METLSGFAPQARSLNRIIAKFAEDNLEVYDFRNFLECIKANLSTALQFGNHRMTKMGVQQARSVRPIYQASPDVEEYICHLVDTPSYETSHANRSDQKTSNDLICTLPNLPPQTDEILGFCSKIEHLPVELDQRQSLLE